MRIFDVKKKLPDGELSSGLPCDGQRYSPLYYRGFDIHLNSFFTVVISFLINIKTSELLS